MRLRLGPDLLKLRKDRAVLFWGFLAVPAFMSLVAAALYGIPPPMGADGAVMTLPLERALVRALAIGGNPIAHLFFAVGAAGIFAGEYRHGGWRHLVPRNSRSALMAAKFVTFTLAAGASLLLLLAGELLAALAIPALRGGQSASGLGAGAVQAIGLSFLVSLLELSILGAMVALMAVTTRSTMGAILPPFLLSLGATTAAALLAGPDPPPLVPLPTFAADAIRLWIGEGAEFGPDAAAGLAVLLAWWVGLVGLTLFLFARQDLTAE